MLKVILNAIPYIQEKETAPAGRREERLLELTPELTLQEAVGIADLSAYYPLSGRYTWNQQKVPYLIVNGRVRWNVAYADARVRDFLSTLQIPDGTMEARFGYPQAGGPGYKELLEVWESVYPILDQFAAVAGVGSAVYGAGKWLRSRFGKKEVPPHFYFDLMYSRQMWNPSELAELLDIGEDDAKKLLISLAYRYDRSKRMYIQGEKSLELKKKLLEVDVYDR